MRVAPLSLIIIIFICGRLSSQPDTTILFFEQKIFDFGEIQEKDGIVSHDFIFENAGKSPAFIDEVTSGCGCTGHQFSNEVILPGQKGIITVTYNPFYRPGFFSKEIVVFSNNHKNINRIWIKGNVIPYKHPVEEDYPYYFGNGLYLNLKVLAYGKILAGKSKQLKLRYANDTDETMILNFIIEGEHKNITYTNPGELSPQQRGEMVFKYVVPASKKSRRKLLIDISPVVNGKKLQALQLKVEEFSVP